MRFFEKIGRLTLFVLFVVPVSACLLLVLWIRGCGPPPGNTVLRVKEVAGTKNPDRRGDVVFIHGLDGDSVSTWQGVDNPKFYFPLELSKEFDDVGFWSVDYPSNSSDWYGPSMPIEDRAIGLLNYLHARDVGSKPVVFVTHSLGGLIAKQMIVDAYTMQKNDDWNEIKENTKGIAFLATPHNGSLLPTYLEQLTKVLPGMSAYRTSEQTEQLKRNLPMLRQLGNQYKQLVGDDFKTLAVFENEGVAGSVRVVGPDSADPGMTNVITSGVDADHASICKPSSVDDPVYVYVAKFIRSTLRPTPKIVTDSFLYFHEQHREAVKRGGDALVSFDKQYLNGQVDWIAFVDRVIPAKDDKTRPRLMITDVKDGNFFVMAIFSRKNFPGGIAPGTKIRIGGVIDSTDELGATLIDCEKLPLQE
jgi:hypothetical protein